MNKKEETELSRCAEIIVNNVEQIKNLHKSIEFMFDNLFEAYTQVKKIVAKECKVKFRSYDDENYFLIYSKYGRYIGELNIAISELGDKIEETNISGYKIGVPEYLMTKEALLKMIERSIQEEKE